MRQGRLCMIGAQEMRLLVSKPSNNQQADEFQFFVPKGNRALPSLVSPCYYVFNGIELIPWSKEGSARLAIPWCLLDVCWMCDESFEIAFGDSKEHMLLSPFRDEHNYLLEADNPSWPSTCRCSLYAWQCRRIDRQETQLSVSKPSNNQQAHEFQFYVPNANRALQSIPPSCYDISKMF